MSFILALIAPRKSDTAIVTGAAHFAAMSNRTNLELARMGLCRDELRHAAFSGLHAA